MTTKHAALFVLMLSACSSRGLDEGSNPTPGDGLTPADVLGTWSLEQSVDIDSDYRRTFYTLKKAGDVEPELSEGNFVIECKAAPGRSCETGTIFDAAKNRTCFFGSKWRIDDAGALSLSLVCISSQGTTSEATLALDFTKPIVRKHPTTIALDGAQVTGPSDWTFTRCPDEGDEPVICVN